MSKASGIFLIAVGVGVAVYAMPFESEKSEAGTPQVSAEHVTQAEVVNPATSTIVTTPKALPEIALPTAKAAAKPTPASAEPKSATPGKSTVIAIVPRALERPRMVVPRNPPTNIPGDPDSLARELQRELRRVGCYDGQINGSWTPASRRAMKLFTDRVNASLPIDRPDYILLRLVQSSPEDVCGAGCPSGQSMSGDGRCLPDAVVAQADKKGHPAQPAMRRANTERSNTTTSGWSTTTTVATRDLPAVPEGRMSLAGPSHDSAARRIEQPTLLGAATGDPVTAVDQAHERTGRVQAKPAAGQRKSKFAAVDNSARRDDGPPRKKFGPWFFRQQERWQH